MEQYTVPDCITDLLAILGLCALISLIWRQTEVMLYEFSQVSIVDSLFAVLFSILTVAGLRVWAFIKREEV